MITLKNEPQSVSDILEQSYSLFKRSLKTTLPYSLLTTIFLITPQILNAIYETKDDKFILVINIIGWLASITMLSALIFRLFCYCYQIPSHFLGSVQHALFKIISLLLLSVLYCLIILSGTMLLIIPGVIFIFSLMFSFTLVITENQTVLQTLITSHRLVWGHWWHVVYVMTIPLLANIALTFSLLLSAMLILTSLDASIPSMIVTLCLINLIVQTFFIPLLFTISLVLLHDLRRRSIQLPRW